MAQIAHLPPPKQLQGHRKSKPFEAEHFLRLADKIEFGWSSGRPGGRPLSQIAA